MDTRSRRLLTRERKPPSCHRGVRMLVGSRGWLTLGSPELPEESEPPRLLVECIPLRSRLETFSCPAASPSWRGNLWIYFSAWTCSRGTKLPSTWRRATWSSRARTSPSWARQIFPRRKTRSLTSLPSQAHLGPRSDSDRVLSTLHLSSHLLSPRSKLSQLSQLSQLSLPNPSKRLRSPQLADPPPRACPPSMSKL